MSLWEYKHITSGPHGFATPALLESYLNQLGKDEWEIISYQTLPTNPLAFNGIARRTTLRDWTLESAAAAAAKIEADKLRAEFAAKFQGNTPAAGNGGADVAAEKPSSIVSETAAPEDGFRKLRDTERDGDPDAAEEGDDWDNWDNLDDDLPTFFEAIKPHLRKNQRGPGQSVGVTFLAKRWEQSEGDLIGALKECGFVIPETEDAPPEHIEFEGELYWLNLNNRHELFLNTREKPRPVYRTVQAKKLDPNDPAAAVLVEEAAAEQAALAKREAERLAREAEQAARRAEHEARRAAAQAASQAAREAAQAAREAAQAARAAQAANAPAPTTAAAAPGGGGEAVSEGASASAPASTSPESANEGGQAKPDAPVVPLPEGEEFLAAIRPQMRRNRRGPGYSGSTVYLARALKQSEADLVTAFAALGLLVPESANDKPVKTTIGGYVYWLNKDSRGGIWINGDEARGATSANAESAAESVNANPDQQPEGAEGTEPQTQGGAVVEPSAPVANPEPANVAPVNAEPADTESANAEAAPAAPVAEAVSVATEAVSTAAADQTSSEPVSLVPASASAISAAASSNAPLAAMRLLLNPNKRGSGVSAEVSAMARELGQDLQSFLTVISDLGLALPATEEHKPSFVEHGDEIFWLNKNPKDGSVWLNAKASKASAKKAVNGAKPKAKKTDREE